MHKVKQRGNGSNTFRSGWGSISPTPPQIAGFGGDLAGGGGGDAPSGTLHGSGEEEWEGGGGRGLARAQVMRLSRQRMWRDRGATLLPRQRCRGAALHRAPTWQPYRTTCTGATEATCHARCIGATKRAT